MEQSLMVTMMLLIVILKWIYIPTKLVLTTLLQKQYGKDEFADGKTISTDLTFNSLKLNDSITWITLSLSPMETDKI
ncbi:MAG: hypothetical protein R2779_07635 [Crocinitomicaceae bacterium]